MKHLSPENLSLLNGCVSRYSNWVTVNVSNPTQESLGLKPASLIAFEKNVLNLTKSIALYINHNQTRLSDDLPDEIKEIIKRVVLFEKLVLAEQIEDQSRQTNNSLIRTELEVPLRRLYDLMNGDWFSETIPIRTPKLTDFLTVEQSEKHLSAKLPERVFDEKFHILNAPQLFLPDLQFFRENCGLRGAKVCIGFIDIDKFKQFNTDNGETAVDREVLPRFMACLESHVYARGHAYRYGGDEYAAILPNATVDEAAGFFERFKMKLRDIDYGQIAGENPDVTVGLFELDADAPLTNAECLTLAEQAKNKGKENWRGSIWACILDSVGTAAFHQKYPID